MNSYRMHFANIHCARIKWMHSLAMLAAMALVMLATRAKAADSERVKEPDASLLSNAIALWINYVKENVKEGDSVEKVMKVMVPKAKEWGRIETHGSGQYELVFKVDDFIYVGFYVDRSKTVQRIGVAAERKSWLKSPTGEILQEVAR